MTIPAGADGGDNVGTGVKGSLKNKESQAADRRAFAQMKAEVEAKIKASPGLSKIGKQIRFVPTREGMRIDLMDDADYSMFALGTTNFVSEAAQLVALVARSIADSPNPIMVRGHTDSLRYGDPTNMNNWMLSSARSEETRRRLVAAGVSETRFERIEGVADREPLIAANPADPRNRRVAITLLYRKSPFE
jgi:chemotaxis protein MotB